MPYHEVWYKPCKDQELSMISTDQVDLHWLFVELLVHDHGVSMVEATEETIHWCKW